MKKKIWEMLKDNNTDIKAQFLDGHLSVAATLKFLPQFYPLPM